MTYKDQNGCNACLANLLLIRQILADRSKGYSKRCMNALKVAQAHTKMHDTNPIEAEMTIGKLVAETLKTRPLISRRYFQDNMGFMRCLKCSTLYEYDQTNHKNYCMVGKQEELIRRGLR